MASAEVKKRIENLRIAIDKYRYEYHVEGKLSISEAALDSLKKELFDLELAYPELITLDSPTQRVAPLPLAGFNKVRHKVAQWSFNDAFNEQDMLDFDTRVKNFLTKSGGDFGAKEIAGLEYISELKIDGLKVVLEYQRGVLVVAATRGDGSVGEDVTQNVRTIESIPLRLKSDFDVIVEGEVFLPKSQFERLNAQVRKNGEEEYANPRNMAAGTLRLLDSKEVARRKLDFFAYDLARLEEAGSQSPKSQQLELKHLARLGFKVNPYYKLCSNISEVISYFKSWEHKKDRQDYKIDGVVVKVNRVDFQETLGYTGKAPRFGIALKFRAEQVTTVVEDIILQVGRTGVITPVARLRSALVDGSTVSRATLHNEDEISRLDVRIGDTVILQKAGDVVPDIVSVLTELRTGKEKKFKWPSRVAGCGGDGSIERKSGEVAWKCVVKDSGELQRKRLYHFCSKGALNIDGCGPKIIDVLVDNGLIGTYADIFTLERGDLASLPRFGDKSTDNLLSSIEHARNVEFWRLLVGLSIPQVGEETAVLLETYFRDMGALAKAKAPELESIDGVGPIVASSIVEWFRESTNQKILQVLLGQIKVVYPKKSGGSGRGVQNSIFTGKSVVLTGTLQVLTRDEAKARIRAMGGQISSSVSKETDFVLAGEKAGSKLVEAERLGITIVGEDALL